MNARRLKLTPAQLSALRIAARPIWERKVRNALKKHDTVQLAANELGVSWRTLMRWRTELGVESTHCAICGSKRGECPHTS